MKKDLDLIIDFNNIFMRSLFTCQFLTTGIEISSFDTDEECKALVQKIVIDLSYIVRLFAPDRVVLVCDSKHPWRNTIYNEIPGEKYKGNREKDNTKNWDKIFNAFDELKGILIARNFIVSDVPRLEADDLAALWKDEFFDKGDNVILATSDRDWHQLISFNNDNDEFCICYNPISNNKGKKKLFVTEDMDVWLNSQDKVDIFFNNFSKIKKAINDLCSDEKNKIVREVINPEGVLLEKIMCGDDGDNIPAFYDYFRNGKKVRVTPLKTKHIFENAGINGLGDLTESVNDDRLKSAMEKEFKKEIELDFVKRLDRQRHLVELNKDLFPDNCIEEFNKHRFAFSNKGSISSSVNMEDILRDTRFINMDEIKSRARESSIFDDIKTLSKFSKPLF